jgi:DNA-binding MarR family transcriptional regulator
MDELLRELVTEITQAYRWLAEQGGINHTDLMCLFFVRSLNGQSTPTAISQQLGLTTGATAIMLNRLEAAGFIERHPHATDRRGVMITLGPAAEHSGILGLRDYVARMNRNVIARYSEEELSIVRRFITDMLHNTRDVLVTARSAGHKPAALKGKGDQPAS